MGSPVLKSKRARTKIVDGMAATVRDTWYPTCRQAGVSERDCEFIRSAFAYEGFFYDLSDPTIRTDDPEELPAQRKR